MNIKTETLGSFKQNTAAELDENPAGMKFIIYTALALWLGLVLLLESRGAFIPQPGEPPIPLFLGFGLPLAAFFAAYFGWSGFRTFVLGADLRFVSAVQGWRWAGLGFLSLYARGLLPGLFALPAGIGDMAIGFTAPWMVLGLVRDPSFAASRRYSVWNIMGIVDLVVAVSMGALTSGFFKFTGSVTSASMTTLPSLLIPTYLVPIFIMLHVTALAQGRRLARAR
jgi:hypothetical protein